MTRMPRSVKVGHRLFEIVLWDKAAALAQGARGDCRDDPPVLRVSKGMKPFDRAEVLLHELLHACWRNLPSENVSEEAVVSVLSENLAGIIADNPNLISWLSENLRRRT